MMEHPVSQTRLYTVEEYLRLERESSVKHEYRDGKIVAMAGGTESHSLIVANVIGEIRNRLKGKPCRVYDSNLRVRIKRRGLYSYPDATVICGAPVFDPDDSEGESVLNARLVIEVLSPSTEKFDRQQKFDQYRDIETFQEYVLVSQEMPRVETYRREEDGSWAFDVAPNLQSTIQLRSIEIELPLAEVFAGVKFPLEERKQSEEE